MIIIRSVVQPGRKVGRRIGYPTINVPVPAAIIKEDWGVYASLVSDGTTSYPAVTHLGPPKTFELTEPTCESHVLNTRFTLTGTTVTKKLLLKIRDIKTFPTTQELKRQISKDIATARHFFGL